MLGRFLELSLHSDDLLASIAFYEQLGFQQTGVGDIWRHPYAVMTDGRLCIGLHGYEFDSPALTFVRPELATALAGLRSRGIHPEFAKLAQDEFNEAGFLSPDGLMIALLEARTFSPPFVSGDSLCGRFAGIALRVASIEAASGFWSGLGFRPSSDAPAASVDALWLEGAGLRIEVGEGRGPAPLALAFASAGAEGQARLRQAGVDLRNRAGVTQLRSPEGLAFEIRA